MRRRRPERRKILPDPVYNDLVVAKFINNLMEEGRKALPKVFSTLLWILLNPRPRIVALKYSKKRYQILLPF